MEPKINGEKQHNLRVQFFGAACSYSRKLICLLFPKTKHHVMLGQLLCVFLNRVINLIKVHCAIRIKSLPFVASNYANNTAQRQLFKNDAVQKAFYKQINSAPNGKANRKRGEAY